MEHCSGCRGAGGEDKGKEPLTGRQFSQAEKYRRSFVVNLWVVVRFPRASMFTYSIVLRRLDLVDERPVENPKNLLSSPRVSLRSLARLKPSRLALLGAAAA